MNIFTEIEKMALDFLEDGQVVDFSGGEKKIDMSQSSYWGKERTISSSFIRYLCSNSEKIESLKANGLRIRGARIEGAINLTMLDIPFNILLYECLISYPIDLRYASIRSLDLSGSHTARIDADYLTISQGIRLSDGFQAKGPVCLTNANIGGDLSCSKGQFDNQNDNNCTSSCAGCSDCRASTLHIYSLVFDRAKINGSVYLCGDFSANGGVSLCDSTIGVNINCTFGRFTAAAEVADRANQMSGRRLSCESDSEYHRACAFNGEGIRIKGNLIMESIVVNGLTRLTGAEINGDLDSAKGTFKSKGADVIHGDRIRVHGNVYFSDEFNAEGIIRLPRAEIGADLSFCKGSLQNINTNSSTLPLLYCEGIKVQGSIYLKNFTVDYSGPLFSDNNLRW